MKGGESLLAVDANFEVVAESDGWIVVNKAAPLIVHPTNDRPEPTLLGGVEQLLAFELLNGARLSIINRLDRETSGLVLLAKDKQHAGLFGRAMEQRKISKEYDALCFGWPEWNKKSLSAPLRRKGEVEESRIWVKQAVHEAGKPSETYFEVVERRVVSGLKVSRLKVFPRTGRMHQIRVHAAFLGFPLVGDKIYGENEDCYLNYIETGWNAELGRELLLERHALHASRMSLHLEEKMDWDIELALDLKRFFDAGE